ncbi:MAG: hypothetical protein KBA52_01695, partial [Candidatus Kapabacteria bacterium]|nr:hypothetical protein [Candidatus Kapabacteria bacterium]
MTNRAEIYDRAKVISEAILGLVALHSIIALLAAIGFYIDENTINLLVTTTRFSLAFFIIQEIIRFIFYPKRSSFFAERWLEFIFSILFCAILIFPSIIFELIAYFAPKITPKNASIIFLTV